MKTSDADICLCLWDVMALRPVDLFELATTPHEILFNQNFMSLISGTNEFLRLHTYDTPTGGFHYGTVIFTSWGTVMQQKNATLLIDRTSQTK
jgi:hypothetical protein